VTGDDPIARRWPARAAAAAGALLPLVALIARPAGWPGALLTALAIAAALHGLGRVVARLAGDPDAPAPLVVGWGTAGYLTIAGALGAAGVFSLGAQTAVVAAAIAAGAAWAAGPVALSARPPLSWVSAAAWALAALLTFIAVLGAAGFTAVPFADEEASYLGLLRRLADTGAMDDGVGFPRAAGLGGHLALAALASPVGELWACHLVDRGVMFGLALALAVSAIHRGSPRSVMAFLVPLALAALPELGPDMAPRWSIIALALVAASTLSRGVRLRSTRLLVVAVAVAAALATVRHVGVIALVIALAVARTAARGGDARIDGWLAAVTIAVVAPYVLAAIDAGARPVAITPGWAPVAFAVAGVTWLMVRAGTGLDEAAREPRLPALTVIAALMLTAGLALARFAAGPSASWPRRAAAMLSDARALAHAHSHDGAARDHAAALAAIPTGTRVGIWVDRPDLIDYRRHRIVDLRRPGLDRCLGGAGGPSCAALAGDLAAVDTIVVELPALRGVDPTGCAGSAGCDHPLVIAARTGVAIGGLRVAPGPRAAAQGAGAAP
jgi:hypothetical protein